jgi:hypothetical protein
VGMVPLACDPTSENEASCSMNSLDGAHVLGVGEACIRGLRPHNAEQSCCHLRQESAGPTPRHDGEQRPTRSGVKSHSHLLPAV